MTVNPGGGGDSPDPDAEETDVFLVMGADRRARKTREEGLETPRAGEDPGSPETSTASETSPDPVAPQAAREHGPALHQGVSPSASEPEAAEPSGPEGTDPPAEGPEPALPDTDTARVQAPPPVDPADSRSAPGPVASVPGAGTGEPRPEDSETADPARPTDVPPEAGAAVSGPAPQEAGSAEATGRPSPSAWRESAPTGAGEAEQAAPYFTYGGRSPEPAGFPDIPAAPYAGAGQPEPGRSVLRAEGRVDPPTPYAPAPYAPAAKPPSTEAPAQAPSAQSSSALGIESWIDAVGHGRTPVQGGYEQRIAAVRSVPASPWRRAVFTVTGGRLNLG
ncbi:hypothetical protein KGD83_02065 [Nocardiopsis akebiae]|uniref:Uncharacterized protein n=1 Tax=Nocardiopsis akebiae TaxID=2831968 RepID=A0ABX8CA26_9ACTN|nr:hypothetical protein [Nocardiopsis akebiae]QUX29408.1 hypothetical protein KGD83_02065 [Nocardiopsis akebiae]